jgi:dihydrofolate synthase/folylpolyglutamate synthase
VDFLSMNYRECLNYLAGLGQELHGLRFGLEAVTRILVELGYPHERYSTAIVAGTNGKGSTSAMLASILGCAGFRTGLYTSPHLVRVNERLRVNGREVSDAAFAAAVSAVAAAVEGLVGSGRLEKPPSFFEFLTATAFQHFANAKVNFVVLEVGMGGRLDATNVTDPRVAVITNIDFDHMEFLGPTLAAIAAEKAGIIKPHRTVISGVEDPEAAAVIRRRAQESRAQLLEMSKLAQISNLHAVEGRYTFDLAIGFEHFAKLTSPLLGRFQITNTAAAVAAACHLAEEGFEIPRRSVVQGLRAAVWPGRLEPILSQPLVLLDGAHNPAGARALATFIREELGGRRLRLVYASMRDKAIREISGILFPLAEEVYLTHPVHARAASPEEILAALPSRPARVYVEPEPARALEKACAASAANDVVLTVGSLYLVGAIKKAQQAGTLQLPGLSGGVPASPA